MAKRQVKATWMIEKGSDYSLGKSNVSLSALTSLNIFGDWVRCLSRDGEDLLITERLQRQLMLVCDVATPFIFATDPISVL